MLIPRCDNIHKVGTVRNMMSIINCWSKGHGKICIHLMYSTCISEHMFLGIETINVKKQCKMKTCKSFYTSSGAASLNSLLTLVWEFGGSVLPVPKPVDMILNTT